MRERQGFWIGLVVGVLALAVVGLAGLVIALTSGDDDPESKTVTVQRTEPAERTLDDCGGFETSTGNVTGLRTTGDCASARFVVNDVLGRDDCVEETPGGVNSCVSRGFTCETRLHSAGKGLAFGTSCREGERRIEFDHTSAPSPVSPGSHACGQQTLRFNPEAEGSVEIVRAVGLSCSLARSVMRRCASSRVVSGWQVSGNFSRYTLTAGVRRIVVQAGAGGAPACAPRPRP